MDYERECRVRKPYKVATWIASNQKKSINRVEYVQLLNLVLRHLGYTTRYLCAIETKTLEELDFIKVTRKFGKQDRHQKSNVSFIDVKANKKRGLDTLFSNGSHNLRRAKRNGCDPKIIREQENTNSKVSNILNRLDQFSFKPASSDTQTQNTQVNSQKSQSSIHDHFAKNKRARPRKYKEDASQVKSNMFVKGCSVNSKKSKAKLLQSDTKSAHHYLSSSDDEGNSMFVNTLKLKYQFMKDYFCLELFNEQTQKWVIVDPFNNHVIESRLTVGRYMQTSGTLLLLAVGAYQYIPVMTMNPKALPVIKKMTFARDVTLKYSSYHNQMLAAKSSFFIEDGI